jgi:hypothetical protein
MDIVLLVIGFALMIAGVLGSFLIVLPGPGLSLIGLILLYFTEAMPMNY